MPVPSLTSPFYPQSNASEKKKSAVYYPCFASLNSEFFVFHSMLWWKYHGFGARETKPNSKTDWANEIFYASYFSCVTKGKNTLWGGKK